MNYIYDNIITTTFCPENYNKYIAILYKSSTTVYFAYLNIWNIKCGNNFSILD